MSEIKEIRFEDENSNIKECVEDYWTERADSFFLQKKHEIEHPKFERWTKEILSVIPSALARIKAGDKVSVLDVGCGAGFFEVMLGRHGFDVTGIDLTPKMIRHADEMIRHFNVEDKAKVCVMDAENLDFPDSSFDIVISRNLTWTLPHPIQAYDEWKRVLKAGGVLINLDAEYAKGAHKFNQSENIAHKDLSADMNEKCHKIYHMLSISNLERPEWDEGVLKELGFCDVNCDIDFGNRLYAEKDEFYMPDRMFMIVAMKN
jgi:SAM-dependent methyltransferase